MNDTLAAKLAYTRLHIKNTKKIASTKLLIYIRLNVAGLL